LTTAQFFVYRRPVAWTALVLTLVWGVYAYQRMPQRRDPRVTVGIGIVTTPYPGAHAEKVEQEVTRKIERKVAENESVQTVNSLSRQGVSILIIELKENVRGKAEELVWQDLESKLNAMEDLPRVGDRRVKPYLNKEFGQIVAMLLTISSPPVSDLEIELRARSIRQALEQARAGYPPELRENRVAGILVYPTTVARGSVLRLGRSLLRDLREAGLAVDRRIVEAPGGGCIDFQLAPDPIRPGGHTTRQDIEAFMARWIQRNGQPQDQHPDIWPGVMVDSLDQQLLEAELRRVAPDKYTYRELGEFADLVQDRLKTCSAVARVEQVGVQREQVQLLYSSRRFSQFKITPRDVVERLEERNINLPGGRVELLQQSVVVQPSGEFKSEAEIGQVVMGVSAAGYPLYLRDLVEVTRGYEDPLSVMNFRTTKVDPDRPPTALLPGEVGVRSGYGGEGQATPERYRLQTTRAITLAVSQVEGTRIQDFAGQVDRALAGLQGLLPDDLRVERVIDEPRQVQQKIAQFNSCLLEAIVLVVLLAMALMEWRSAILVAASIPLTLAMTLGICHILGVDLQQVSIAALIIALGLLVDDPVVAADAINRELAGGEPRDRAAWLGPQKLARAILFSTITNIVSFLPLLLVTGRTGEFVYSLPIVVSAALASSRIVSMTFMPLLGYYVLRGQKGFESALEAGEATGGKGYRFARAYNGFSEWCLRHKAATLLVCLVALAGFASVVPWIGTSFFPKDMHNVFSVNLYLSEDSPILATRREAMEVVRRIDELEGPRISSYTTFVGAGGPRFWLSIFPEQPSDNYAQILVHTADREQTAAIVRRLRRSLPSMIAAGRVTIEQLETGPPVGIPVQVRVYGPDVEVLRRLSQQVKDLMVLAPGSESIHDDWDPPVFQVSLDVNPDYANLSGITHQDVAAVVNTGLSGYAATQLREKDKLIDITLRLRPEERSSLNDLYSLDVMSVSADVQVPLRQIARFEPEMVSPKIRRRNHERCVTVKCETVEGVLPSRVVAKLQKTLPIAAAAWPVGYRYEFGGEKYEQEKGFASVTVALIVSVVSIYAILVLQFSSVTKPLVVFAAVPFGLGAGMMGLPLFGAPFGFMAFLGVASLAGTIVSHIIVLFDYIEEMGLRGEPVRRAVIDAALVRLRPVLVTVLTTVGGLVPLAIRGGPLWEPMCYVMIVGLLVATVVTKVIVPVLYVVFVEDLRLIRWKAGAAQGPAPPLTGP
jgi:multidrug efflux pump subunit AcrB